MPLFCATSILFFCSSRAQPADKVLSCLGIGKHWRAFRLNFRVALDVTADTENMRVESAVCVLVFRLAERQFAIADFGANCWLTVAESVNDYALRLTSARFCPYSVNCSAIRIKIQIQTTRNIQRVFRVS